MKIIKLVIPFDANIKTRRIIGHLIFFLDVDVTTKPIVVANYVSYNSVLSRGKLWDEWQINEQNAIELNNSNNNPVHSIAKMLRISIDEVDTDFKHSILNYYGKASRLWDFNLVSFLKNEFDYSWIEKYKGPTNRNSIITYYAKINGDSNVNIKLIEKLTINDYIESNLKVLENICEYNPDLYEYLAEKQGYQLNNPGLTPHIREWLIKKYQQNSNEIFDIIKIKSKYWAKLALNIYQETLKWLNNQKKLKVLSEQEIDEECYRRIKPYCDIATNISLNWIAFWRFNNLIKEKKLNKIYANLFTDSVFEWTFVTKLISFFETENWKEIAGYLDPTNVAWLPTEINVLLNKDLITIGKKGIIYDKLGNELSAAQVEKLIKDNVSK